MAATRGRSLFPAATASTPEHRRAATAISVTVVLPLVPVTAAIGLESQDRARSNSLAVGTPPARAAARARWCSGSPGVGIIASAARTSRPSRSSSGAACNSRPKDPAAATAAVSGPSSKAVTVCPLDSSARATARFVAPNPASSSDRGTSAIAAAPAAGPLMA